VLSSAAIVVGTVLGGMSLPRYNFLVPLALAIPFLLFLIIYTGLAEELGWRGFALPHLQKTRTAEGSSWILGIAWGLWHLPSVVFLPLLAQRATIPQAMFSLLGLTTGVVGYTIVLTWLYNNTQNLFWLVILHERFDVELLQLFIGVTFGWVVATRIETNGDVWHESDRLAKARGFSQAMLVQRER